MQVQHHWQGGVVETSQATTYSIGLQATVNGDFPMVKVLIQTPTRCYGDNALVRAPVDLL